MRDPPTDQPMPQHSGVESRLVTVDWPMEQWTESVSKASSAEQANEWVVRANEWADEQMAPYSMRQFRIISTHCGPPS